MRKRKTGRKLARKRDQRRALKKSLAVSLVSKKRIKTTLIKAKELRPFIEKLVTKAKAGNLAATRHLLRYLPKESVKKLVNEIAPQFQERPGGYTRIIKLGRRKSDNAKLAMIEFILPEVTKKIETKKHGKENKPNNSKK